MNISRLVEKLYSSLESFGYARAATQLQRMSDIQLLSLSLSRNKIAQGRAGLPWTIDSVDSMAIAAPNAEATQTAANQAQFNAQTAA